MTTHRPAAFWFIFVVVLLDVMALGIVIPVLPKLVESFSGGDIARAAYWVGVFTTVWALAQFVCSPIAGALSDRYGRRPVVLLSCFALAIDYALMALAPNLMWLLVGRILSGVFAANAVAATAYIADVTPEAERAQKFGMLGAAWGLGFVLGPALGGWLGGIELRLPFWVAGGVTFVNALYGFFVLPESLKAENRAAFDWKKANPLSGLSLLAQHKGLLPLAIINFLYNVAHYIFPTVFALYTSYRYGWSPQVLGFTLALVGVLTIIVQGALVQPIVKAVGERKALWIGLTCGAAGFAWLGLAQTQWVYWSGLPLLAFMGLFGPAVQALMTQKMPADAQGRLQGFNASVTGIAGLVGPIIFSTSFAAAIASGANAPYPGMPFFIATLLMLIGFALSLLDAVRRKPSGRIS
jgi:MFS transporter, DHA1 family, tetracycline resistance protein